MKKLHVDRPPDNVGSEQHIDFFQRLALVSGENTPPENVAEVVEELERWLDTQPYHSVRTMKKSVYYVRNMRCARHYCVCSSLGRCASYFPSMLGSSGSTRFLHLFESFLTRLLLITQERPLRSALSALRRHQNVREKYDRVKVELREVKRHLRYVENNASHDSTTARVVEQGLHSNMQEMKDVHARYVCFR